jgi:hypothetical protein
MKNTIPQTALEGIVLELSQDRLLPLSQEEKSSIAGFEVSYETPRDAALDLHYGRQVPGKTVMTPTIAQGDGFWTSIANYQNAGFFNESLLIRIPEDVAKGMFLTCMGIFKRPGWYSVSIQNGVNDLRLVELKDVYPMIQYAIQNGKLPGVALENPDMKKAFGDYLLKQSQEANPNKVLNA